VSRPHRY